MNKCTQWPLEQSIALNQPPAAVTNDRGLVLDFGAIHFFSTNDFINLKYIEN